MTWEECLDLHMVKKKMVLYSHNMAVMYANALYKQGFIKRGVQGIKDAS